MSEYHIPVLLDESVTALISDVSGVYADATFGGGGHTSEILSRLSPGGRVLAFDRDADALGNRPDDPRLTLIHNNFRFIHNFVLHEGYAGGIDGVLADLGVSSHQFDTAERGFSFRYEAPLDMRMNKEAKTTAADIVNTRSEDELEKIFRLYGEVDGSRRMARMICTARQQSPITTTSELDKAIEGMLPKFAEHKFLAKVYQALRIEVNQEMKSLEKFLYGAARSLKSGGRLVVITYHSLEDRMVKNFIRSGNIEGKHICAYEGRKQEACRPAGGRDSVKHKGKERETPYSGKDMKVNFGKIWELVKNSFTAILRGEFLLRLRFDRWFLHIIYFFVLCALNIWVTLEIEQTMLNEEKNKARLEELKIYHAQKTCELVSLDRLSTVERMLKESGSRLTVPQKPADRIE